MDYAKLKILKYCYHKRDNIVESEWRIQGIVLRARPLNFPERLWQLKT